ncbi:hypothetical protein FNH09_17875 [Streptomyces adustus]|uniref:Uncharacterized protein n=1 Tax=Streptomyces adustus TaxID=1609272 RepID=A0A5N8VCT9_9ACTN|nr:hypothetical protein [Streptomyces adustus]
MRVRVRGPEALRGPEAPLSGARSGFGFGFGFEFGFGFGFGFRFGSRVGAMVGLRSRCTVGGGRWTAHAAHGSHHRTGVVYVRPPRGRTSYTGAGAWGLVPANVSYRRTSGTDERPVRTDAGTAARRVTVTSPQP